MGAVRLGKISLRWCKTCNVPVIELESCGKCGSETEAVKITPPGDYRPAFEFDIDLIRDTVDRQFGTGCGQLLLPDRKLVALNKCPGVDRMDEVIVDGYVVGTQVFEPGKGWRFVCRLEGAQMILPKLTRSWVKMDNGAVPSMTKGSSAMAVGVLDGDNNIQLGDEVIMVDQSRNVIATGPARMTGKDMLELDRGPAVKTRWYKEIDEVVRPNGGQTWDMAVEANLPKLQTDIQKAITRIHYVIKRVGKETAVAFSGGKDSLATLHLVLDAGLKPKVMFVDTGIEFQETLDHVQAISDKHNLELVMENAGEAYFDAAKYFGPSAKDFRWCCKTCKLGPTASLIRKHFPDGVLSFIGQRQYESEQRYQKGGIWVNPWVPGQIGASPIQKWPSMEVWLYIFHKKEEFNILYEKGFERIGCWLCPAADMAEHKELEKYMPRAAEWQEYLSAYAEKNDLPDEWVSMGLWRWKNLSKGLRDYLERQGLDDVIAKMDEFENRPPQTDEIPGDMTERISVMSKITGGEESEAVVKKALHCVGCGICISRCDQDALHLKNKIIILDEDKCISCGKCLHPCPVVDFSER